MHISHEGEVGAESGVEVRLNLLVVLWSRRLTVLVVSPARDAAVASDRQRMSATRGDGDEVTLYAVRRRLAVEVGAPARNIAVALQRQRVNATRGDGDEVALYAVWRRLAVIIPSPARNIAVAL